MTTFIANDSNLIFLGATQRTSKEGNPILFVKLGDVQKFENYDFIIDPQKVSVNLPLQSPVLPVFEIGVYNGRPNFRLVELKPVK